MRRLREMAFGSLGSDVFSWTCSTGTACLGVRCTSMNDLTRSSVYSRMFDCTSKSGDSLCGVENLCVCEGWPTLSALFLHIRTRYGPSRFSFSKHVQDQRGLLIRLKKHIDTRTSTQPTSFLTTWASKMHTVHLTSARTQQQPHHHCEHPRP